MALMIQKCTLAVLLVILIASCSGSSNSVAPSIPDSTSSDQSTDPNLTPQTATGFEESSVNHYLLSYNLIYLDATDQDNIKAEIIPLREGETHLNVLKFLEDGPCFNCFRIVGFSFPGSGTLNVDLQFDHPFDDLLFSVFDVRGIMMFQGSHEFPVAGKSISDPALGDGALVNPDGYTALYNGSTASLPIWPILKYYPGNMATPTIPDSDINGYKYFVTDNPSNNRNALFAGTSDVVTFTIKLPTGPFVLGYAVDANWWAPISEPVDDPLTDFDLSANCPEPWKVIVAEDPIGDGLTDKGGQTKLIIDAYDWQGKTTHRKPVIECPELFDGALTTVWVGDGPGFNEYEVTVSNDNLASAGEYDCLVGVEGKENDPIGKPWLDLTGYQIISLEVTGSGNLIWAKRAGGITSDQVYGITTLSDDSTVITGGFSGTSTFGPGEPGQKVLTSSGGSDIFVARYNTNGTLAWAKKAGGSYYYDLSYAITTLSDDSIVVTGGFGDTATFGQGEPNQTDLNAIFYEDTFVAHYNSNGTLAWAKSAGGSLHDYGTGITTLSDNTTIATGTFAGSVTFGPGEPNETVLTAAEGYNIFIARYNMNGTLAWAKNAEGSFVNDTGNGIRTLSDNSVVLAGGFNVLATFGPGDPNETDLTSAGGYDIFVARYNPNGTLAWAKCAGGIDLDKGTGITALSNDSTIVTGMFGGSATFGPGEPNQTILTSAGDSDIFIARFSK